MHTFGRLSLVLMLCTLLVVACQAQPTEAPPAGDTQSETVERTAPTVGPTRTPVLTATPASELVEAELEPDDAAEPTEEPTLEATTEEVVAEPAEEAPEATAEEEEAPEAEADEEATEPEDETPAEPETPEASEAPAATPTATRAPTTQRPSPIVPTQPGIVSSSALVIRDDETVAPPLTVIVSANRELDGYRFFVSGLVRNDADVPYGGIGVIATYFRDDGSRFGPVRAQMPCTALLPGATCPFMVEVIDKNLAEVMLHPEGYPTQRQPLPVEVRSTRSYRDSIGWVHITGSVYNPNPVAVRDVSIAGALLDQRGEIVNLGTDLLLEPLAPEQSATFDVLVRYVPYTQTQLFVQAFVR